MSCVFRALGFSLEKERRSNKKNMWFMRHAGGACGPRRTMTSHSGDARALSGAKLTPWCEYVCLVRRVRSAFAFLLFLWGAARPYPLPPSPLRLPEVEACGQKGW